MDNNLNPQIAEMNPEFLMKLGETIRSIQNNKIFSCFSSDHNRCYIAFTMKINLISGNAFLNYAENFNNYYRIWFALDVRIAAVDMES